MTSDFLSFYAILHALFFVLAAHILYRFSQDIATQLEYTSFRFLLVVYLAYLITNVVCTFIEYGFAAVPNWFAWLAWYGAVSFVVLIALSLYMFTVFRYAPYLVRKRWFQVVTLLPLFIIALCMLASLRNGMVLRVTPDNHVVYGRAYPILPLLSLVYFAEIFCFALYKSRTNHSYIKKKQLGVLIMSTAFVVACTAIETFFRKSRASLLPASVLIAIIFLYFNMQDSGIYTDTLTGLNNRRKANEYLGEYLNESAEKAPLYLYMCDVNYFKRINDGYGHAEGDRALVLVAEAIKGVMAWYDGFAARLGGDEFLLTWVPQKLESGRESPEAFIDDLQSALALECARSQKPYSVTLSMGYAICDSSKRSISDYIQEADEMLYERKREYHEAHKE